MIRRLRIYFKEMYPIIPRLILSFIIFFEIYFIILLNSGITEFSVGPQEIAGSFTIFAFLLFLRIADDFKDYETDKTLFPDRAFPSGKVLKKDLLTAAAVTSAAAAAANILLMNNLLFFAGLYGYGALMSVWFFRKKTISKSLPLALVTHNPVQIILNFYVISFTCIKYGINIISWVTLLSAFTLYFPALIWEISRKIRAPKDETEYITYSKLFGYKKPAKFVMILIIADIITNYFLVFSLNKVSVVLLSINLVWILNRIVSFIKNPAQFSLIKKIEAYTYIQESIMLLTVLFCLLKGKI